MTSLSGRPSGERKGRHTCCEHGKGAGPMPATWCCESSPGTKAYFIPDRDWRSGAGTMQYGRDGDISPSGNSAKKDKRQHNVVWKRWRLGKETRSVHVGLGGENVYPGAEHLHRKRQRRIHGAALNFAKENPEGGKPYSTWPIRSGTGINRYIDEVGGLQRSDIMGVADDDHLRKPPYTSVMSQGHDDVEAGFELIGSLPDDLRLPSGIGGGIDNPLHTHPENKQVLYPPFDPLIG